MHPSGMSEIAVYPGDMPRDAVTMKMKKNDNLLVYVCNQYQYHHPSPTHMPHPQQHNSVCVFFDDLSFNWCV